MTSFASPDCCVPLVLGRRVAGRGRAVRHRWLVDVDARARATSDEFS